jgi:NTP pyrophosphatase (non-canonical NTP hydrolase)
MDLQQFVKDATVTESIKPELNADFVLLSNAITMFINAGQILDQIKKNSFYGKPFKHDELKQNLRNIATSADNLIDRDPDAYLFNQEQINNTVNDSRIIHSLLGICTEATEMGEALYDYLENQNDFDLVNLSEEAGDLDWYKAILSDTSGIPMETVLETVINKLKARYPEGFTAKAAIERDLTNEREVLEAGFLG